MPKLSQTRNTANSLSDK